ncbi:MAG: diguanylate cyclase [Deltaproteobacteria bacterium]|nr:diguanylate cyclase [Deltaproteobacteria bacterium]
MRKHKVLVADPDKISLGKMGHFLDAAGYEVLKAGDEPAAWEEVRHGAPDLVVLSGDAPGFNGCQMCSELKNGAGPFVPCILTFAGTEEHAEKTSFEHNADCFLLQPVKRSVLVNSVRTMLKIKDLEEKIGNLRDEVQRHLRSISEAGGMDPITKFYNFEFFKKILAMELKRAQRYHYPLSVILMAFDKFDEMKTRHKAENLNAIMLQASLTVRQAIRELDLPVQYSDGHIMVVMPHTPLSGATVVAERLRAKIAGLRIRDDSGVIRLTGSIGLAAIDGNENVSFHDIARRATAALGDALKTGNRVVCA